MKSAWLMLVGLAAAVLLGLFLWWSGGNRSARIGAPEL